MGALFNCSPLSPRQRLFKRVQLFAAGRNGSSAVGQMVMLMLVLIDRMRQAIVAVLIVLLLLLMLLVVVVVVTVHCQRGAQLMEMVRLMVLRSFRFRRRCAARTRTAAATDAIAIRWRRAGFAAGQVGEQLLAPNVAAVLFARPVGDFAGASLVARLDGCFAGAPQAVARLFVQRRNGAGGRLEGQPQGARFVGAEAICGWVGWLD